MEKAILKRTLDPSKLVFRPVTQADLTALEWGGAYLKYRGMYANLYRNVARGTTLMWLVETHQGDMVGQAFVMLKSSERDAADGIHRAYLFAFRIKPPYRNQGIGTALMDFVEKELFQRGFRQVTLNVARDNPGARRLYERLGYRVIGSKPGVWSFRDHQGRVQHVNEPAWRMMKRLVKE